MDDYIKSIRKHLGNKEISIPGCRALIINSKNEVLLEERSDFKIWGLPGGSADPGEGIVRTIEREVFEETGLKIKNPIPFGFLLHPHLSESPSLMGINYIRLISCFTLVSILEK